MTHSVARTLFGYTEEGLWNWALSSATRGALTLRVSVLRALLPHRLSHRAMDDFLEEITTGCPLSSELQSEETIEQLEVAVGRLLRSRVLRTTCLYRALIRFVLLRQHGVDVQLVMGIADPPPLDGDMTGHAWLERDGVPLRERLQHNYKKTVVHPRRDVR